MKPIYETPQIEVVEIELEDVVLGTSGDVQSNSINSYANDDAF